MNKNKPNGKPDVPERKDLQEQDDELLNEDGIGPGTGAQTAVHHHEDSTEQQEFIRTQDRNAQPGRDSQEDLTR